MGNQISQSDYHNWHVQSPDLDEEESTDFWSWSWLSLPDGAKSRMRVHWMGIGNAFGIMLLTFMVLAVYLSRSLHYDFRDLSLGALVPGGSLVSDGEVRYGSPDMAGWKLLHADVFRPPGHRMLFCSCVGAGVQLTVMGLWVILLGCVDPYHHRGSVISAMAHFYVLASLAGGYVSGLWYQRLHGDHWSLNTFLTALIFAGPVFCVWSIANTIAIFYNSTAAIPFGYILLFFLGWVGVTLPLTILSATVGRHMALRQKRNSETRSFFSCRTNRLERKVPEGGWLSQQRWLQYFVCGSVPFCSIYVELHYVLDSVWGPARYTVYGILFLAAAITLANAALITILWLYVQLNREDWKWWWRSFLSGASIGVAFCVYSVYFYCNTVMDGFLQTSFFVLYSLCLAYGLALVLGSFTFLMSANFMSYVYGMLKSE